MDSAILISSHQATASGAADATRPAVRGFVEKYAFTRTVNFLQLNINGIQRKCAELSDILHTNNIHVACLQETKLNPNLHVNIKGYTTIRKDRISGAGGGIAFLVKTAEIKYTEVPLASNSNSSTEAQAINILLPKHTITVVNVYHPDNSPIDTNLLKDLSSTSSEIKIILGDFNAKSPSWGCKVLDFKGDQVEDLTDDLNLTILNTGENTYISKTNGTASALDITAISSDSADKAHWRVLDSAISDHYPVLTTLSVVRESPEQVKRSWNFRKANWPGFTEELESLCSASPEHKDLEKQLLLFTSYIQKAAKHHIPRGKRRNDWVPFWKDFNIEDLIYERDSISQQLQRNNSEQLKQKFIEVSHRVEEMISESKKEKWAELCSKLDPTKGTSQYWNLIKVLNNSSIPMPKKPQSNVISIDGVYARTNKEAANMLAKQYEITSKLKFTVEDRLQHKKYKSIIENNKRSSAEDIFTSDFTLEELDYAIQRLNPKKSPGPDVIFGHMIVHFGEIAKRYLLNIFNTSWRCGKLPKIWKSSTIIPILKTGKDASSCKSYRPISLTCILCKLMERIIHCRLYKYLTEHNILNFYQTAYRANHSTVDQLFYLSQTIINGFQEKPHKKTVAVFLDLSSAFDRVWRQKLIDIIHNSGIKGNALLWINDFLRGRKFSVKFNGVISESHRLWAGVPQGSVLSPLLFLVYMNTIHSHIHPDTKIACYADDIALWHTHRDIAISEEALNKTLKGIATWAKDLKLTINADKTNYCIFSTDRHHRGSFDANIKIEDSNLKRVFFPTYLGVTLDPELRFSRHIEQTSNKALGKLNLLRKLCGTSWGSRPKTLKSAYCSIIRPVLEYAAPIWSPASTTSKLKLDLIQHRAAKIIIGAVSSTNNEKAEQECGLHPLECRRNLATIKFTNKLNCCNNDHVSTRVFNEWKGAKRLKRSSTLQLDRDIRSQIKLEYSTLDFLQEPLFPRKPPKETKINLHLLKPCSKKEDPLTLRQKGLETIEKFSQGNLAIVYTDGSSDISLNKGGAGVLFHLPNEDKYMRKISTGLIASNFTSELLAIKEALTFYMTNHKVSDPTEGLVIFSDSKAALEAINNGETNITSSINILLEGLHSNGKSCLLQWIPAHVNIEGNECADSLAKEGRDADQPCTTITLADANAVARHRLLPHSFKKPLITEFDCSRILTSTITRLRTNHYKGMKILPDNTRTYIPCKNCTNTQLTPDHILECPALTPYVLQLGMVPLASELRETLYSNDVLELADAVLRAHEAI